VTTHNHSHSGPGSRIGLSIVLTTAFVVGEGLVGLWSNSLALLSDAGHNLSDALALGFTWYALRYAMRPADAKLTYGYHRGGILAALANALALVVIALFILWEAVARLRAPEPVASGPMIAVAAIALVLNTVISSWLRGDAKNDLNIRSAYVHMLGDAVSSAGVIVAGIVVALTGSSLADPVVSLLIAGLIVWSSWGILSEALNVLLEAVPKGLDMVALERAIRDAPAVLNVHDLHVWTVSSGIVACSCHILVTEQSVRSGEGVLRSVCDRLRSSFGIAHITIQVEVDGCTDDGVYCTLQPAESDGEHEHS